MARRTKLTIAARLEIAIQYQKGVPMRKIAQVVGASLGAVQRWLASPEYLRHTGTSEGVTVPRSVSDTSETKMSPVSDTTHHTATTRALVPIVNGPEIYPMPPSVVETAREAAKWHFAMVISGAKGYFNTHNDREMRLEDAQLSLNANTALHKSLAVIQEHESNAPKQIGTEDEWLINLLAEANRRANEDTNATDRDTEPDSR